MRLKKILLRYYPPELGLELVLQTGETRTKTLPLPELLDHSTTVEVGGVAARLAASCAELAGAEEQLREALGRLQQRTLAERRPRHFRREHTLRGHLLPATCLALAPRTPQCATGSYDRTCRVWHLSTEGDVEPTCTVLEGHRNVVFAAAFSLPHGDRVLTGSWDGTARLWHVASGSQLLEMATPPSAEVLDVVFSPPPTNNLFATARMDSSVRLVNGETGQEVAALTSHTGPVVTVRFTWEGERLVSGSTDSHVSVWDVRAENPALKLTGHTGPVSACALPPCDCSLIASSSLDGSVRLWDLRSTEQPLSVISQHEEVLHVEFDGAARRMVTAGSEGSVFVWDTATSTSSAAPPLLRELKGHQGAVHKASFSPGGALVLSAGADGTARVWRWQEEEEKEQVLTGHVEEVFAAAFATWPGPERLVTLGRDNTCRVWRHHEKPSDGEHTLY